MLSPTKWPGPRRKRKPPSVACTTDTPSFCIRMESGPGWFTPSRFHRDRVGFRRLIVAIGQTASIVALGSPRLFLATPLSQRESVARQRPSHTGSQTEGPRTSATSSICRPPSPRGGTMSFTPVPLFNRSMRKTKSTLGAPGTPCPKAQYCRSPGFGRLQRSGTAAISQRPGESEQQRKPARSSHGMGSHPHSGQSKPFYRTKSTRAIFPSRNE